MSQYFKKSTQLGKLAEREISNALKRITEDNVPKKRSALFPNEIGSPSFSIESSGSKKNDSIQAMKHHTRGQISKLQEQADLLVIQLHEIEKRAALAEKIATARFNFKPVLLKAYYLYKEKTSKNPMTLTLIAPEEWNGECPFGGLIAKVRQLGDSTWEILDNGPEAIE